MAGFGDAVTATDLHVAVEAVVEVLGPDVGVWQTIEGERRTLAEGTTDGVSAAVTGLCRATIEVVADADPPLVQAAAAVLAQVSDRLEIEDRARRARRRLTDSERMGALGAYAWDAVTDKLEWTDGLFRIYGHRPGSFEPSYVRFTDHVHPDDRERVRGIHRRAMRTGETFEMEERIVRPDGEVRTLWSIGEVTTDDDGQPAGIVGVCRDITEQREAEREVADADLRRRQALELNDNVIQGLVSLLWHLDDGAEDARRIAEATLSASRRMVTDLLHDADDPDTGKLVRQSPADLDDAAMSPPSEAAVTSAEPAAGTPAEEVAASDGTIRVVVADDLPTMRMLVRMRLAKEDGVEVVAEACDGQQATELVERLRPDVVVMDLGMPVLDGIQATRRIVGFAPETRVIVLSGYPAAAMAEDAAAAGAECYLEKSGDLDELCATIVAVPRRGGVRP